MHTWPLWETKTSQKQPNELLHVSQDNWCTTKKSSRTSSTNVKTSNPLQVLWADQATSFALSLSISESRSLKLRPVQEWSQNVKRQYSLMKECQYAKAR